MRDIERRTHAMFVHNKKCHKYFVFVFIVAVQLLSLVQRSEYRFRCIYYVIFSLLAYAIWISSTRFVYAAPSTFPHAVAIRLSRSLSSRRPSAFFFFLSGAYFIFFFAFKTFQISHCHNVFVCVCVRCLFRADLMKLSSLKRYSLHRMNYIK